MSKTTQREKPRITAEPYLNAFKIEDREMVNIRVNEPFWLKMNYFNAIKKMAEIKGTDWESLLWTEIQNHLHENIERLAAQSKRLGRDCTSYLAEKYELSNVIPERQ